MLQPAFTAQCPDHTEESFLADIVYQLPGAQTGPQLDGEKTSEIRREVLFHLGIARSQAPDIVFGKRRKLHLIRCNAARRNPHYSEL